MRKIHLVIILLVFFIVGCNQTNKTQIGVILPLSGEVATYGQSVKRGLDIAIKENGGERFELIYEDSKADKATALNALEKLSLTNVQFFIGDATSSVTYAIGPKIQANNGLLLVPIATGDGIREIGDNVLMISPRNEKQTKAVASFIKNNYPQKKIACLFKQNDYGVNIAETFSILFADSIYTESYQNGQSDFKTILLKLKEKNIEVVFVPGNYEETAVILKQAKELNYTGQFIGTDGAYSPKLVELAREASEGFLLAMMPISYESKMYLEFAKYYSEIYGDRPDIFACYGYESAMVFMDAIDANESKSVDKTLDYLLKNSFNSLTGKLSFDSKGEAIREYQIYRIENGSFIVY